MPDCSLSDDREIRNVGNADVHEQNDASERSLHDWLALFLTRLTPAMLESLLPRPDHRDPWDDCWDGSHIKDLLAAQAADPSPSGLRSNEAVPMDVISSDDASDNLDVGLCGLPPRSPSPSSIPPLSPLLEGLALGDDAGLVDVNNSCC